MYSTAKKVAVGIIGGLVVLIGILMIPLPGPAFLVIPAGLAILATEFPWAQRLLDRVKAKLKEWKGKAKAKRQAAKAKKLSAASGPRPPACSECSPPPH